MSDDFDSNHDYGDDFISDVVKQDLDDDDIAYNSSHPYRKSKNKKADEEFAKFWRASSMAGKIQIIVYVLIYAIGIIVGSVASGVDSPIVMVLIFLISLIPYAILCLLVSAFIIEPILKKLSSKNKKEK